MPLRALEGYPHLTDFGHIGTPSICIVAGFQELGNPQLRRIVMRIDFTTGPKNDVRSGSVPPRAPSCGG